MGIHVAAECCSPFGEEIGPCQKVRICLGLVATVSWHEVECCIPNSVEGTVSEYRLVECCTLFLVVGLGRVRDWHMVFVAKAGHGRPCCMPVAFDFERSPAEQRGSP